MSVLVPNQRHLPGGCGVSFTGTFAAASSCEVNATIGCENVTLNSGAIGTATLRRVAHYFQWTSVTGSLAAAAGAGK